MKPGIIQPSTFTLHTFFQKFELFADAPNAVGKLREFILQLAARGKLVQQSSDDEPASALVLRIKKNLEALRSRKELRGSPVEALECGDLPAIPSNWEWVRLGNVVDYGSSDKAESADIPNDTWLLDLEDIEKNTSRLLQRKSFRDSPSKSTKTAFAIGDVLYGKLRPYLNKVIVADAPGYCTTEIIPIRAFGFIDPAYLCCALKRPEFLAYASSKSYGMNLPRLGTEDARRAPFPLPPLAEQKRIVAKVDELMALCDRLEAQQQERGTQHAELARASLARFADAPTPANLNFFFHPSYAIPPADLRKSILTLAVQGLLVSHDAESADWETRKLKDLTTKIGSGSTPSGGKESYQESGVPLIRSMNVHFGGFVRHGLAFLNEEQAEKLKNVTVKAEDVLLNITGASIGRVSTAPKDMEGARVNQHVCIVRPIREILPAFLQLFLASPVVQNLIDDVQVGATREALTKAMIEQFEIPVPSIAEQRRIVAKVDQLMVLVDQLETQLATSQAKAKELLDAVIQELLNPSAEIIAFPQSFDRHANRSAVACYILQNMAANPSFGRTVAAKLLYLAEAHIGLPLDGSPLRMAAGPLDPWIYSFEKEGVHEGWFGIEKHTIRNKRKKIRYIPKPGLATKATEAIAVLADQKTEFNRLLNLFSSKNTEEAEIIATLFAAWNDFLLDGLSPNDEAIIHEVRENWHPDKARFTPAHLQQWLDWMKQNQLVPKGQKPRTKQQLDLLPD